jgi:hypothetical protein
LYFYVFVLNDGVKCCGLVPPAAMAMTEPRQTLNSEMWTPPA